MSNRNSSKPTLLFIHGFRGNHLGLTETADFFRKAGYPVYSPDIPPAFNLQDEKLPTLKKFTADGYATWVAEYILNNHLDRPVLIGHSMGSIIAATTAEKYPNLIHDKIFFLSPISAPTPIFLRFIIPLIGFLPNKLICYIVTKYLIAPIGKPKLRQILDTTYRCAEKITSTKDEIKAARFSTRHSIFDFNFQKTVFFIAGDEDKLNHIAQTKKVAAKFHGKTTFIPHAGHLINYELPQELYQLIAKELET